MKLKVLIMSLILGFISFNTNSQTAEEWNQYGKTAFESYNYEVAIKCLEQVIKLKPNDADAYYNMGLAYAEGLKQYEKAIECYKQAIELKPDLAEAYNNIGVAYDAWNGQYEKAIECYEKAIELKPDFAEAYNNMGLAYYFWDGQYEKAIEYYKQAIEHKSDLAKAYLWMGFAYLKSGNEDKAIANLKKAAQIGDYDAEQWLKENGISY